jgi:hypothetical protein
MNTNMLKLLSLLALTGCIVTGFGVVKFWQAPLLVPKHRQVLAWRPDFTPSSHAGSTETAELSFAELSSRPIFAPSRRPFVPPVSVVPEPPPEPVTIAPIPQSVPVPEPIIAAVPPPAPLIDPAQFQLKGIMQSGNKKSALIVTPQSPDGAWMVKDSDIMGWTLVRIERNSVLLNGEERDVTLQQYSEKPTLDQSNATAIAPGVQPSLASSVGN